MIVVQLIIFLLVFAGLIIILRPPRTLSFAENMLREKRETIAGRKLAFGEKWIVRIQNTVKNAGFTLRVFFLMTVAAFLTGTGCGLVLFSSWELGFATGLAFLPLPYILLLMRGQHTVRKQLESLENTMSVITNAYIGGDDIVEAFYRTARERNHYRDTADSNPFDEFVTEVLYINPDVQRALSILELKIHNYHFSEWVKMLQLCHHNRDLKFALPPIVKAMGDAKAMQIESDTQMAQVWRDYGMTVALMFGIIPILRFANADWYRILTTTGIGKLLIVLMLIMALVSTFIVTHITRPLHSGRRNRSL